MKEIEYTNCHINEVISDNMKTIALACFLGENCNDIFSGDDEYFDTPNGEYRVLDEDEVDTAWEDELQMYLDDIVLPEIPEHYRFYFDEEKWIEDAKMDGRGHVLAHYDGNENEFCFTEDGSYFFIFRTN